MSKRYDFRDVSTLLQSFRELLLGRKHTLHVRFAPKIAPRSIPTPDIPKSPEIKYSNQYYHERNVFRSVRPPVIAPGAGCADLKKPPPKCHPALPTPGPSWGWDNHCYFECVPDPDTRKPCPPSQPLCPPPRSQSTEPPVPPCPATPDQMKKH